MIYKLTQIALGWFHFVKGDPATRQYMSERLAICDLCHRKEQLSESGTLLMSSINQTSSLFKCGVCQCPLSPKTAAPNESCPLGKW